jgi:hypothetical protein
MHRFLLASVAVLLGCGTDRVTAPEHAPTASFATITRHLRGFTIPWTQVGFVSCANGGAGERVQLTGEYHWFINFTGNEKWQVDVIGERFKLTGVGEVTGDAYRFHQVSHSVTNIVRASGLNIGKRWITRGFLQAERGGSSVYLKDTLVFRLDAQGNPIVDFRHTEFACR